MQCSAYSICVDECEVERNSTKIDFENNFEKQLEVEDANNELLLIISSNSCSPSNINTPDSKTAHQRFFFNSLDSVDTFCSSEYAGLGIDSLNSRYCGENERISYTSKLPCRTKNPFYKNEHKNKE